MRLTKKQTICNIPILKIRDYFSRIRPANLSPDNISDFFNLDKQQTEELIQELSVNGFIEPAEEKEEENDYQLTIKGNALCVARYTPPIKKEKADKLFQEFMQRVEEINSNDYYIYKVSKILLFGSYINPEKTDYSDIDIAFELERKIDDTEEFGKLHDKRVDEASLLGKSFPSFFEALVYTEQVVLLKLKNKCRYISLHRTDDKILELTEYKQVYP